MVCCVFPEEPKLRHVETDVLIPKMMREKAKELCNEKVQGGRLILCPYCRTPNVSFVKLVMCPMFA